MPISGKRILLNVRTTPHLGTVPQVTFATVTLVDDNDICSHHSECCHGAFTADETLFHFKF